jgi:hypothetical protein
MALSTSELVESYLNRYGWSYHLTDEKSLQTGWSGEEGVFPLKIVFYENWVGFQVRLFKKLAIDWESWPEISRYLLEWNDGCHMVRTAIGPKGDINLSLDLPTGALAFDLFAETLTVLGHYTERLYKDLLEHLDHVGYRYCKSLDILT